jgi:coproporphyrinogen III oxidase-like Fe-S oxidoreductase
MAAVEGATPPPREIEQLDDETTRAERVLLGLRLDEPLPLAGLETAVDADALRKLERLGLARLGVEDAGQSLLLTPRGRCLGGGVTADLLA